MAAYINASKPKRLEVVGGCLAKAAKILIVSKLIAISYPRDGKSWLAS